MAGSASGLAIELLLGAQLALKGPVPLVALRHVAATTGPLVHAVFADGRSTVWNASHGNESAQCDTHDDDMLHRALQWLKADCIADFVVHEQLVAPGATMYGTTGAKEVLAFKRRWLSEKINYEVNAILDVDFANRVVVASFNSFIPGKEGRGTEVLQFDEDLRVSGVSAIRHAQVSP